MSPGIHMPEEFRGPKRLGLVFSYRGAETAADAWCTYVAWLAEIDTSSSFLSWRWAPLENHETLGIGFGPSASTAMIAVCDAYGIGETALVSRTRLMDVAREAQWVRRAKTSAVV